MQEEASNPHHGLLAPGQYHGQGRFELKRLLGEGGMGQVWLAWDQRLNDSVALKFLPPAIRNDAAALDNMRREALKSRKLSHPNIVRIHDLYENPGELPFISMEFVDGDNLATLRVNEETRFFSWDHLKPLVKQLCEALEYAHSEGVIHRDLKPGNMMVDRKGRLKLADFGIAATISDSSNRVSVKHPNSGTLAYMSPQHLRGEFPKAGDDIYALGATLYELLTSTPPFCTGDIVHQIEAVPAKPLDERLWELGMENTIPADVSALILACLSKDPTQRPQSARAVAEWIGLEQLTSVQPTSLLGHTSSSQKNELPAATHLTHEHEQKPRKTLPTGRYVAAALIIVGVGLAAFWFLKTNPSSETESKVEEPRTVTENVSTNETDELTSAVLQAATKAHNGAGRADINFPAGIGGNDAIQSLELLPNQQHLIAGRFTEWNGKKFNRIAILNPDASYNPTFKPGVGPDNDISHAIAQPDGKILIAGPFEKFDNVSRRGIARLNADGTLDTSFNPGTGANKAGRRLLLQSDGKVILAGFFTKFNGEPRNHLVRLMPDGSIDPNFNSSGGPNDPVLALCQTADGHIWIGGSFTKVSGVDSPRLAALDPNGKLKAPSNTDGPVLMLHVTADQKILVGGTFSKILGEERRNLARLISPDRLDTGFKTGTGFNGAVRCAASSPDGCVLIGGDFNRVDGSVRRGLVKLQRNGSLDPAMDARLAGTGTVRGITILQSGAVIVAGDLARPESADNARMAKILGASPALGKVAESKAFTIPANPTWIDTSFDVAKDSVYEILALGTVKLADGTDLTPDGLLQRPYTSDIGPQGKPGNDNAHPARSIIAQIGENKLTLFIGSHQRFVAPTSGRLKLRVNFSPDEKLGPSGLFHITVRRLESLMFTEPDWRFEVAAKFDTTDELHLRFGSAQWVHKGGGAVVGRHNRMNLPTIFNGVCVWPEWSGKTTLPMRAPGLLYPNNKSLLKVWGVLDGRGRCQITEQTSGKGPGSGADYCVITFSDGGNGSRTMRVLIGPDNQGTK